MMAHCADPDCPYCDRPTDWGRIARIACASIVGALVLWALVGALAAAILVVWPMVPQG